MYRLTIVAGPNRGSSFMVQEGESSIGRQAGNSILLESARVSKRHCIIRVSGKEMLIEDQGSSNGTFVNGALVKKKPIGAGDRISVGEYILEIDIPSTKKPKPPLPVPGLDGSVAKPLPRILTPPSPIPGVPGISPVDTSRPTSAPRDLKGKLKWIFDQKIMPFFYGLNLKYEWNVLLAGLFAAFVVANLLVSVQPLIDSGRRSVIKEASVRARFIAKLIVERNAPFLSSRQETKLDIDEAIEKADGVQLAVLLNMENRVLAPRRATTFLTDGPEAVFAVQARDRFERKDSGLVRELSDGIVTAVEPVLVYDSSAGRNIAVGMAMVSVDTGLGTPDLGEMGVIYSKTIILTGLIGALISFILYRITLRPLLVLTDDIEKVLKGDLMRVTREYKVSELEPLWDLVDSTLQRLPKGTQSGQLADAGPTIQELAAPVQMIGDMQKQPLVVCDANRVVVYLNQPFEDVSGIRAEAAIGQTIASLAREQSFATLIDDLFERASVAGTSVDDYEFSGVGYKLRVASFAGGGQTRGFVIAAERQEG